MELQNVLPADIEKRSMEIIAEELGEIQLDPEKVSIVKRVIHTSLTLIMHVRCIFRMV